MSASSQGYAYRSGSFGGTVCTRWYVRIATEPESGNGFWLWNIRDSGGSPKARVYYQNDGGTYKLKVDTVSGVPTYTVTLNVDTWYCLEVKAVKGTSNGELRVYLDGSEVITGTNLDMGSNDFGMILVGLECYPAPSTLVNVYTDCLVVADAYVGPEASSTLQTVTDSLLLSDGILRHKTLFTVTDSAELAEALLRNRNLALTDSARLSDLAATLRLLGVFDGLSLADTPATPSRSLRAPDFAGLADNAIINKTLQITDNIAVVEVAEVGVGGTRKTKLFLLIGDLAVQLTGE